MVQMSRHIASRINRSAEMYTDGFQCGDDFIRKVIFIRRIGRGVFFFGVKRSWLGLSCGIKLRTPFVNGK